MLRRLPLVLTLAGLIGLPALATAASPELKKVLPRGAQRGTELEVVLSGQRLDDAQEVLLYVPGITVRDVAPVDDKQVKARFQIAGDCALGTHRLRVRTKTGLSDLGTFTVGALPSVDEKEPNNDFKQPQAIATNSTVNGTVTNEDLDYFAVEAKKGERLTVEIEGLRLGDTMFDPYVAILNEARFELESADDTALLYQDGVASLVVPEDGRYIVLIRDSSYGGNGDSHYRAHIGTYPQPRAVVPAGGKPGSEVEVRFLGDVGGEIRQKVTLPASGPEDFAVHATDAQGISPAGLRFRLSPLDNVVEAEPNEAAAQATPAAIPSAMNGYLATPADSDLFKFTANKGQVIDFHVYARRLRSELDSVLQILNEQGGVVANGDDSPGTPDSQIRFTAPADGTFLVKIRDHLGRGGDAFHYRIEATPVTPQLTMNVAEFNQYQEVKLAVPQGNRLPLLVAINRRDFGGPLEFSGVDLPPGVSVETFTLAPDQASAQIILKAEPEAPLGARQAQLAAKLADPAQPNLQVAGRTEQNAILIRGQNQVPFWVEPLPTLAVAVVEKVPFRLEIVEPKVPVVQGGTMKLKVVAHREGDFKAPIKIDLNLNPPGVNSSREVSIAEGQTEALIDINAAGNAKVGPSQISVRGVATVGNGPVMVSTPFATLNVAEQYLKFALQKTAVEQGQETEVAVKIEQVKPFEGEAAVTLVGLPAHATTEPAKITKDAKELVFKVKVAPEANPGLTKNLFCNVIVTENGEPIAHNLGSGELRIDKPLPPKNNAPAPAATPAAPQPAQPKRLTRLEQLREEQKQKAAAGAQP